MTTQPAIRRRAPNLLLATAALALALGGCTGTRSERIVGGALIGGGAGAVIGAVTTGSVPGALVGGAIGAAAGAGVGAIMPVRGEAGY